jgi:hypothetical protein
MGCAEKRRGERGGFGKKQKRQSEIRKRKKRAPFFCFLYCFQSKTTENEGLFLSLSLSSMPSNRMSPTTISFLGNRELFNLFGDISLTYS